MDLKKYIRAQKVWSEKTFGEGKRTIGITEHIKKEIKEILENPDDYKEWIDIVILALDGAWRTGAHPDSIVKYLMQKQKINIYERKWPSIFPAQHEVSEHIKEK